MFARLQSQPVLLSKVIKGIPDGNLVTEMVVTDKFALSEFERAVKACMNERDDKNNIN